MRHNVSVKYWKNKKANLHCFLIYVVFFHVSRLKPMYPCWHSLSRLMQVKEAWLAEIPFWEGKSRQERCLAAPLISLWDAASDGDILLTAVARRLAVQARSPARPCAPGGLWACPLGDCAGCRADGTGLKAFTEVPLNLSLPRGSFWGEK